jgi:hypothetical protein
MRNRLRFFSDLYDSVSQRHYPMLSAKPEERQEAFIGRLRFDTLLSRTLVLTDAQLLDGAFFVEIDKPRLARFLQRTAEDEPLPLEIRSRAARLENALTGFFKGQGKTLAAFHLSLANEDIRDQLADRVASIPASSLRRWDQIPTILSNCGIDPAVSEQLKYAWRQVFDLQDRKAFRVVRWAGKPNIDAVGDLDALRSELNDPDACAPHLSELWGLRDSRNAVLRCLNEWYPKGKDLETDRWRIINWFNAVYNRALVQQHGCLHNYESIYQNGTPRNENTVLMLGRFDPHAAVESTAFLDLPQGFIQGLGAIEPDRYRDLFKSNRRHFESWWGSENEDSLKRALDPFVRETDAHRPQFSLGKLLGETRDGALIGAIFALALGSATPFAVGAAHGVANYGLRYLTATVGSKSYRGTVSQRVIEIARRRG